MRDTVTDASEAGAWEKFSVSCDPLDPPSPVGPIMRKVLFYFCDTEERVDVPLPSCDNFDASPSVLLLKNFAPATLRNDTSMDAAVSTRA